MNPLLHTNYFLRHKQRIAAVFFLFHTNKDNRRSSTNDLQQNIESSTVETGKSSGSMLQQSVNDDQSKENTCGNDINFKTAQTVIQKQTDTTSDMQENRSLDMELHGNVDALSTPIAICSIKLLDKDEDIEQKEALANQNIGVEKTSQYTVMGESRTQSDLIIKSNDKRASKTDVLHGNHVTENLISDQNDEYVQEEDGLATVYSRSQGKCGIPDLQAAVEENHQRTGEVFEMYNYAIGVAKSLPYSLTLKLYCFYKYTRPCVNNRIWGLIQR